MGKRARVSERPSERASEREREYASEKESAQECDEEGWLGDTRRVETVCRGTWLEKGGRRKDPVGPLERTSLSISKTEGSQQTTGPSVDCSDQSTLGEGHLSPSVSYQVSKTFRKPSGKSILFHFLDKLLLLPSYWLAQVRGKEGRGVS